MADLVIIDDDSDNLDILTEILALTGHGIRAGYNGRDGLRFVRERYPDLVLVDVEMPLLDGPGMAYRMRVDDMGMEKIPVILLSGAVNLREVAAQVGTPYFLAKPYRFDQITAMVDRALAERSPPQPRASRREPEDTSVILK